MNLQEITEKENPYKKKSYAWYMVGLMTIAYMFSFIDRYICLLYTSDAADE